MTRLKCALMVSVAVNLFALGAVASFFVSRLANPPPFNLCVMEHIRGPLLALGDVDRVISPEGLLVRDRVIPPARPRFEQAIRALLKSRAKVLEIAAAPTLDLVALEQALNEMGQAEAALTSFGQQVMLQLLTSLSDQDRIAIAQAASRRLRGRSLLSAPQR